MPPEKRDPPIWSVSETANVQTLKLYNSFTRQKEEFKPKDGKKVLWYSCGPTVYDASHMGHARSYMTFDILRRVLSEYFGYDVLYVMNVTDIDDKIIKKARKEYLFSFYADHLQYGPQTNARQVLHDAHNAIVGFYDKAEDTKEPELKNMLLNMAQKVESALPQFDLAIRTNDEANLQVAFEEFLALSKEILSEWLDINNGSSIQDNSLFCSLPNKWEEEFHKDMNALNILKPDVLTRVTDYIPEIINYIEVIIENKIAYVSNGSVYFDVAVFNSLPNRYYAKLVPEAYGDINLLQEGEGELSQNTDKKSPHDFALWKASKGGEPSWTSPWGNGRPGWHIECSVMASAICGDTLDIHTGGVDLKFPHHDNELAQAEAYFNKDGWVRYFLHSGHLKIEGQKMSKSLKNFITIKDALNKYTSRQLRLLFLLHSWKDQLDYSENTMEMALTYEKTLVEFFLSIKDLLSSQNSKNFIDQFTKYNHYEYNLNSAFQITKDSVHIALCDNIDTRTVLEKLRELINICNSYVMGLQLNYTLIECIARYITKILKMFGIIVSTENIGFPLSKENDNFESSVLPYLRVLGDFRDSVRESAKKSKDVEILKLCDEVRDVTLPELGVRLEDKTNAPCAIKLVDKTILHEEKKAQKEECKERKQVKSTTTGVVEPSKMFLSMIDRFSKFNVEGLPTHDADGKELSKAQTKKLMKQYELNKKKYEKFVSSQ